MVLSYLALKQLPAGPRPYKSRTDSATAALQSLQRFSTCTKHWECHHQTDQHGVKNKPSVPETLALLPVPDTKYVHIYSTCKCKDVKSCFPDSTAVAHARNRMRISIVKYEAKNVSVMMKYTWDKYNAAFGQSLVPDLTNQHAWQDSPEIWTGPS